MGRVVVVAVVLLCLICSVNAGAVRRDPVTGKWVDASDMPAATDRRAGGKSAEGGDFFSGFTVLDNTKQNIAPSSLVPDAPLQDTRPHRKSKYSFDLPVAEDVQTAAITSPKFPIDSDGTQDGTQDESVLVQTTAQAQANGQVTEVEHIYHKFDPEDQILVQSSALKVRTLGNLCRFQGVAPASGCPAEATNGCVDHIPCKLSCPSGGFFRWRCLGPQLVSPSAFTPPSEPEVLVPPPPLPSTDDFVHDLAGRIGKAIQNNDYTGLARAILQAQTSSGSSVANAHLALAVSQLSQMQQSSTTVPAATNSDIGIVGDEDVAL